MPSEPRFTRRIPLVWVFAFVLLGLVVPVGAWGSGGQNVNLSDKSGTAVGDEARITNNKLGVAVCSLATAGVSTTNCAQVVGGGVKVTDGTGPMTVDGSVGVSGKVSVTDGSGPLTVDGAVSARPVSPATPWAQECQGSTDTGYYPACSFTVNATGVVTIETVGLTAQIPAGQSLWDSAIEVVTKGVAHYYPVLLTRMGSYSGLDYYQPAAPDMRLYADPGSTVYVYVGRSTPSGTAYMAVRLSGHR